MSIFNVFLDSPMLTVSVILFATCVVIGFFGDRYFKKHGTTIIKPSPKQTDETKVSQDQDKQDQEHVNTDDNVRENESDENKKEVEDVAGNEEVSVSNEVTGPSNTNNITNPSENISSYIVEDDNFNNMF